MEALLTIGNLAYETDIPSSTIRYYERKGLIAPDTRSSANYRLYGPKSVDRLHFIRTAQSAGFTLADITALLRLRDGDIGNCGEVRQVIELRLGEVLKRIKRMTEFSETLNSYLEICKDSNMNQHCQVLDELDL